MRIDRVWVLRIAVAAIVVAGLVLVARAAMLAIGSGSARLERFERGEPPAAGTATPPRPAAPASR